MRLRLGTRRSELAVRQSEMVADLLRGLGHEVELVRVVTDGDVTRRSLTDLGGLGVFAAQLRMALLEGACDLAVHSMKDLPTAPVPGLVVAAVPERATPRDVLCARDGLTFAELPAGARVGSGSPRRVAQLRALRDDLVYVDLRGNVGTRLARVREGDLDAVVLAGAGLDRIGASEAVTDVLTILPAPAQGALAVECRADDARLLGALAAIDHAPSHLAADAERAVLAGLGGGCAAPIGALASDQTLTAGVFAVDGRRAVRASRPLGPDAAAEVVADLLARGAADVTDLGAERVSRLAEVHDEASLWGGPTALGGVRILLTTDRAALADGLRATGAEVTALRVQEPHLLDDAPARLPDADWIVFTSATTPGLLRAHAIGVPDGARVAAVGAATARAATEAGFRVDLVPGGERSGAQPLLDAWPPGTGRVVVPGSVDSAPTLADGLRALGWAVTVVPLYAMRPVATVPDDVRRAWEAGDFDAVVVTAGSAARALDALLGWHDAIVAFGEPTAAALRRQGRRVDAVCPSQDADGIAAALSTLANLTHRKDQP